ncbi:hypothetical protein DFH07DRAFT_943235 [Mycena maculata]|uniref:MYND-type domain-containing protein n=1 Tax=Mycena maculata TaxID=230809 RepID=A0AAD7IHA9_9AGAR|nr:hypothetical protein DFH07DRAFT_943235 [Mycena maculata]
MPKRSPCNKAIPIYIAALKDLDSPLYCVRCLTGLICQILSTQDVYHDAGLDEFWDVSTTFLTQRRSEEEMEGLLSRLCCCNCPNSDPYTRALHTMGAKYEDRWEKEGGNFVFSDAHHVARTCFPQFLLARFSLTVAEAKPKNVAKGVKGSWPQTIVHLMPFGAEITVDAMVQWHRGLDQDMVVFALLAAMVPISRTLLMPDIAASALPALMVSSGRALFDRTYTSLDSSNPNERRQSANSFFVQAAFMDAFLLSVLSADMGVEFARGYETKLVQLCNLFVHISTDPRIPDVQECGYPQLEGCTMWASHSYRLFHMYLPPRPPIILHPNVAAFDVKTFPPPPTVRNLRESVHMAIVAARRDMACSAVGCTRSLQTEGRAFMCCARCCVVCYCSTDCQTRAWKEEKYPRRRICPIISALVRISDGAATGFMGLATTLNKWAQAQVPEADFQLVRDWFDLTHMGSNALLPNGTEWRPGFDDYDEVVSRFGADGKGPKSFLVNPLARWPSEVAKAKAVHEALPFCGEDI